MYLYDKAYKQEYSSQECAAVITKRLNTQNKQCRASNLLHQDYRLQIACDNIRFQIGLELSPQVWLGHLKAHAVITWKHTIREGSEKVTTLTVSSTRDKNNPSTTEKSREDYRERARTVGHAHRIGITTGDGCSSDSLSFTASLSTLSALWAVVPLTYAPTPGLSQHFLCRFLLLLLSKS